MKKITLLFYFVSLILASPCYALRCGNKLVSEGATMLEVSAICGEPLIKENESQDIVEVLDSLARKSTKNTEEWLYDFGENKLIQILRFENNKLTQIKSGGYGGIKTNPEKCQTQANAVVKGENKTLILLKCGYPQWKASQEEIQKVISAHPSHLYIKNQIDVWYYQSNPNHAARGFIFRNGIVDESFN